MYLYKVIISTDKLKRSEDLPWGGKHILRLLETLVYSMALVKQQYFL